MDERTQDRLRGQRLEYFTVGYNAIEGIISLVAGGLAGSVALIGFGLDSCIELISGLTMLWRLQHARDMHHSEASEKRALKIIGWSFILLALYVAFDATHSLLTHDRPETSYMGIAIAVCSIVVMMYLVPRKHTTAHKLKSGAMHADAKQTELCGYLSVVLLGGLLLNTLFGWWWADPLAGLVMVAFIAREGVNALRGKGCCVTHEE